METIWDDLRDHFESAEIPESHKDLLRSRRQRVQSGDSKLLDWDDVKSSIGRPRIGFKLGRRSDVRPRNFKIIIHD